MLRTPVGWGLMILVTLQAIATAAIVFMALRAIKDIAADTERMYTLQLESIAAIGGAMREAAKLTDGSSSPVIDDFLERYRSDWEIVSGTSAEAVRFRNDLRRAGESDLSARESEVLTNLKKSLQTGTADNVRQNLALLHGVISNYAAFSSRYAEERQKSARNTLLATGLAATFITGSFGLFIFYTVVPRAKILVERTRQFMESGKHERIGHLGNDAIGLLANALDAGFSAISQREREREEFFAIAAHELKTPLTSIQGYSSLVISHPDAAPLLFRALEVINRQSWRMIRLIDGLFLAMRARAKDLQFTPKPFDFSALIERVLDEMKPFVSDKTFSSQIQKNVRILGDEALLEQALWSLFTSASALASNKTPIHVSFGAEEWHALLLVTIEGDEGSVAEMEDLFKPFRSVELNDTATSPHLTTGLYLCREIVRVHNGQLRAQEVIERQPEFVMELPI